MQAIGVGAPNLLAATEQASRSLNSGKKKPPMTKVIGGFYLSGGSEGIRTPDPLHAMQVRYRAAPRTQTLFRIPPKQLH
jgi:hypothetical protein